MKTFWLILAAIFLLAFQAAVVTASDPNPLQDFCVAIDQPKSYKSTLFVNGKFCKDPKLVKAEDFLFRGLDIPGNTGNKQGSNATLINVDKFPGLNTLGIAVARIDYAPYGLNPPHSHPRASEFLVVLEGTLLVGFITSDPIYTFFSKVLNKGDVFVFPIGLIHFQFNVGHRPALALAGFNSQNPGRVTIANAVFGSDPSVPIDVLSKAFHVEKNVIIYIQKQFEVK